MWADFLSHFSEIGMIEGAEAYQVIKQRPADHDQQQSQISNPDHASVSDEPAKNADSNNQITTSAPQAPLSASDEFVQE